VLGWSEGYILTRGIKLHYYRGGEGTVPLLMLHGISDDGMCWAPVASVLADMFDVVLVDIRAHGKSDAPDDGYNYSTMADELVGLIESIKLEKPVLMGHSMGAMIALITAGKYPAIPRVMVLEDPPAFWSTTSKNEDDSAVRKGMRTFFEGVKNHSRDELLTLVREENPAWPAAEYAPWVESKLRFSPKIMQLLDFEKCLPPNVNSLLTQIVCPTLLITADQELGAILGEQETSELNALVPQLEHVPISGAGHNIRREQSSRYMDVVTGFLKDVVVG
jgi:N-formylmaleamate deformylase